MRCRATEFTTAAGTERGQHMEPLPDQGRLESRAVTATRRRAYRPASSRSRKRCSLPVSVRGNASTNSTVRGYL